MPVLLTSRSSRPYAAIVRATASAWCAGSSALPGTAIAWSGPPSSWAATARGSGVRAVTQTRQPPATSRRAIARPIPRLAPVTSATLSVIRAPNPASFTRLAALICDVFPRRCAPQSRRRRAAPARSLITAAGLTTDRSVCAHVTVPVRRGQGGQAVDEELREDVADLGRVHRAIGPVPGQQVVHAAEEEVHGQVGRDVQAEQPGRLPLLHQLPEPLVVPPPLGPHRGPLVRVQQVHREKEHGRLVLV